MDRKNLIIIAVAAVVAVGAYIMFAGGDEITNQPATNTDSSQTTTTAPQTPSK